MRKKLIIVTTVLVAIALTLFILEKTHVTHFLNPNNSQQEQQKLEADINSKNKKDLIENKSGDANSDKTVEPSANDIALSTHRETDKSVTIITKLQNYSDGTCDLTIKNGSKTQTQTAPIIYQVDFSTCAGFNIPESSVGVGTWQISLSVTSKGKVYTKTISVEVQ